MTDTPMNALVVASDEASDAALAVRVLQDNGDQATHCVDVPEALSRVAQGAFDVAFVSLSLPRGDGLALVHHLRALYPGLDLVAMVRPDEVEEAGSAMALGVLSTVVTPLTGDDVLVTVDRIRERRILLQQRQAGEAAKPGTERVSDTLRRCAAFVAQPEPQRVAAGVLNVCEGELASRAAAIYLPAIGGGRLLRVPCGDSGEELPEVLEGDAYETLSAAEESSFVDGRLQLPLRYGENLLGVVLLAPREAGPVADRTVAVLRAVAPLAGAALSHASLLQAATKGGIKDDDTGAYTFAYFGDVAARELDRALRHHRAFGLLTIQFEGLAEQLGHSTEAQGKALRRALTQAMLGSVRVSDVVARRDDQTFYVLLPETGLLGALACRRRILHTVDQLGCAEDAASSAVAELLTASPLVATSGISVFPGDGEDLSELLKLSRRRADRASKGLWKRHGLDAHDFWGAIDALLDPDFDVGTAEGCSGLSGRAAMPLPLVSKITESLIRDAARDGVSGVLYLAGDAELGAAAARATSAADRLPLRTWLLGPARSVRDPAASIRLPLTDSRLNRAFLVLCITERGGYCLAARGDTSDGVMAFHSSDLDVVEGLVSALQRQYHLQPELG